MRAVWAIRIKASDLPRLAPFRLDPNIEIWPADPDQDPSEYWLRGSSEETTTASQLRLVPAIARYHVNADNLATPLGNRVPELRLPEPDSPRWANLARWWQLHAQPAALEGELPGRVNLRIVPAPSERPASGILTDTESWQDFASTFPAHRLARLRFAADIGGRVFVIGTPIPPLRGEHFSIEHGIALPAGCAIDPPIDAPSVARLLSLPPGAIALFSRDSDARYQRIDAAQFTQGTRSAARLTALNATTRDL